MPTRFRLIEKTEGFADSRPLAVMPGMSAASPLTVVAKITLQAVDANDDNIPGQFPVAVVVSSASEFSNVPVGSILGFTVISTS